MKQYVVVGGGLAGLTAANALADKGHRVTLFEQSGRLGGRAATQSDHGYLFNFGPHALYQGGAAAETLRRWGIPFQGRPPAVTSASFFVREGRMYPLVSTIGGLLKTRLFHTREKWQAARILQQLFSGKAAQEESMQEWIERRSSALAARQFAAMLIRVSSYCANLSQLSAQAALAQFRRAAQSGVWYLDSGWQTLVHGLEQRARRLGVKIQVGEPVARLDHIQADGVILAVPPASVEQIMGRAFPQLRPVRVACLDLGLRCLPAEAAHVAFGLDQPLYLSVHSAVAQLAPAGSAVVHVCKYLEGETDAEADRLELERFASLAMPGWQDHAEVVRFLPRMTVTHAIASPQGRPDIDATGMPGVALAGDWIGPQGMLADAAVASALRAAAAVQQQRRQAA
jgi:phytoene dehydrogenase-like protein